MNGKKLVLVALLIAILGIGWFVVIQTASGAEDRQAQTQLVEQADVFAQKGLYVRAIPLYVEALGYRTEANAQIEAKLLSMYEMSGEGDSYTALVEKRAADGTAAAEEYVTAAEIYINSYSIKEAMELVRKGIGLLGSQELADYYEAHRYGYEMFVTNFQDILPTATNDLMPAFDGEKWGYVNANGRVQLAAAYDTATRFNANGYAVVSQNGKYFTIITDGSKYGLDEVGATDVYSVTDRHILAKVNGYYSYYNYDFVCMADAFQYDEITSNACGVAAVKKDGKWGIITDVGDTVVDFVLDDVAVNSLGCVFADNVGMVKQGDQWYLINVNGERLSETGFAGAKAPESSQYIAVTDGSGKWGYINQKSEIVIPYQYDDALSFSDHLGAVKILDDWAYISERNEIVIDENLEDAQPFHNGIAQAKFIDGEALLKLSYREE